MTVLSLFDGLSCGRLALEKAGIEVDLYISSEVDKYAIQVADANWPQDRYFRKGDIRNLDPSHLPPIDMVIGGSPCQGFSLAGKMKGSATSCGIEVTSLEQYLSLKEADFEFEGQSYLFWEFVRLVRAVQPKYFFLENVRVTKKWLPMFNEAMGVEPIMINSALVSAQNRVRYYWTNIPDLTQPEDKGIMLKDILDASQAKGVPHNVTLIPPINKGVQFNVNPSGRGMNGNVYGREGKSPCLTTNKGEGVKRLELREFKDDSVCHHAADATDIKGHDSLKRVYATSGKSPTLTTCQGGNREVKILETWHPEFKKNYVQFDISGKGHGSQDQRAYYLEGKHGTLPAHGGESKVKVLCGASRGRYLIDGVRQDGKGSVAGQTEQMMEVRPDEKTNCLTTVAKDNYVVEGMEQGDRVPMTEHPTYRKLTPLECERLQTVRDGYTNHVSNSQRYKMLGNGWTIDVIAHLFQGLKG